MRPGVTLHHPLGAADLIEVAQNLDEKTENHNLQEAF